LKVWWPRWSITGPKDRSLVSLDSSYDRYNCYGSCRHVRLQGLPVTPVEPVPHFGIVFINTAPHLSNSRFQVVAAGAFDRYTRP
jgi:hypothetical protein